MVTAGCVIVVVGSVVVDVVVVVAVVVDVVAWVVDVVVVDVVVVVVDVVEIVVGFLYSASFSSGEGHFFSVQFCSALVIWSSVIHPLYPSIM